MFTKTRKILILTPDHSPEKCEAYFRFTIPKNVSINKFLYLIIMNNLDLIEEKYHKEMLKNASSLVIDEKTKTLDLTSKQIDMCFEIRKISYSKNQQYNGSIYIEFRKTLRAFDPLFTKMQILKRPYNLDCVSLIHSNQLTDQWIDTINKCNSLYHFCNLTLSQIYKIDINKIGKLEYSEDRYHPKIYDLSVEVIKTLKTSVMIDPEYDWLQKPGEFQKHADLFYYSGSLLNYKFNLNFDFRFNLFTVICHLLDYSLLDCSLLDCDLDDNGNDLLVNPIVFGKIAKFTHEQKITSIWDLEPRGVLLFG